MTEAEWLACNDPLKAIRPSAVLLPEGRVRAIVAATAERIRHLLDDDERQLLDEYVLWVRGEGQDPKASRPAVTFFPMGRPKGDARSWASGAVRHLVWEDPDRGWSGMYAMLCAEQEDHGVGETSGDLQLSGPGSENHRRELIIHADQMVRIRDIFGNPFRPVAADPAWLTPTAVGLAHAIYDARAFDRLPVLADALEEAGCDHPDVLAHCRGPGPHIRGCWVVDLVLGKS